eukprot:scaffold2173_cov250-Pinguiococcus_pyrenoidosus.AAC.2
MLGGAEEDYAAARPVLDALGGYHALLGPAGSGAAAKLVNQLLTATNAMSAAEGIALASELGCDVATLMEVLQRCWGNSTMLQRSGGIYTDCMLHEDPSVAFLAKSRAPLRNFEKDLMFVDAAASRKGLPLPTTDAAKDAVSRAMRQGFADIDWTGMIHLLLQDARAKHVACVPKPSEAAKTPPGPSTATKKTLDSLQASLPREYQMDEYRLAAKNASLQIGRRVPVRVDDLIAFCFLCGGILMAAFPCFSQLVVIDDDPTGTQTVHSLPVLGDWSVENLSSVISDPGVSCFYILSNTRALDVERARARATEISANVKTALKQCRGLDGVSGYRIVSRGDSTLRGHFFDEVEAIASGLQLEQRPVVVLAPFFEEGGRITYNDTHYVVSAEDDGALVPAAETEFAKDRHFGYRSSDLRDWIQEKTQGRAAPQNIHSLSVEAIRAGGPEGVLHKLRSISKAAAGGEAEHVIIVNSVTQRDMLVAALSFHLAEEEGLFQNGVLYRTAGSFVSAFAGVQKRPLLQGEDLVSRKQSSEGTGRTDKPSGGLVLVGSYVGKSTTQLEELVKRLPALQQIEIDVKQIALDEAARLVELKRVQSLANDALRQGTSAVVYTSREKVQDDASGGLEIGQKVTDTICDLVRNLEVTPSFLVAKGEESRRSCFPARSFGAHALSLRCTIGGITSNDVAVVACNVRTAWVLGQVVPGVPVWQFGDESRFPGMKYVVFPGNVGRPDDLARVVSVMSSQDGTEAEEDGVAPSASSAFLAAPDLKYSIREMLEEARENQRAVGAFNVYNLEGALAVRDAAEALGRPAILQFHPGSFDFGGAALLQLCAEVASSAKVPMATQLDHAANEKQIIELLETSNVNGVMADGSAFPLDENRAWTKRIVDVAHKVRGRTVEAELGKLAGEEDGLSVDEKDAKMTDPAVVAEFIAETRVDALAVTIGNVHGKYARSPPVLDWDRLDQVIDCESGLPRKSFGGV